LTTDPLKDARDQLAELKWIQSAKAYSSIFRTMVLGVTDLSPAEYLERYQRGLEKHARGTSPDPEAYEHWGCHAASSDIRHWSISLLKNKKHFKKPGAEFSRAAHTSSDAMKFDASSVASLVTSQRLAPSRSP
jgi:hypothetical protein